MPLTREQIAQRVARELQDGFYVNLGIGIPTLVSNVVPPGVEVGELDPDQIHVPSVYVKRLVQAKDLAKPIEKRTVRPRAR